MQTISLYDTPQADGTVPCYDFSFPGNWDEARDGDLLTVCHAMASGQEDTTMRFELLRALAGIPRELMGRMPPAASLTFQVDVTDRSGPWKPVEKMEWRLLPQLDWAFAPPVYSRSLLTEVTHKGVRWKGPANELKGMSLAHWVWSTTMLGAIRSAKDSDKEAALNNFLGVLYLPMDADGKALPFDPEGYEARGIVLSTLAPHLKLASVMNYEALHGMLERVYPRVFDPEGDVQRSPAGMYGMAYDVASSGVFGDTDKTEVQPALKVLDYMEHKLFQDALLEEKSKAQQTTST